MAFATSRTTMCGLSVWKPSGIGLTVLMRSSWNEGEEQDVRSDTRTARALKRAQHETRIVAAETETVRYGAADTAFAGNVRHVVQVARRVRRFQVDRRVDDAGFDSQGCCHRLDAARRT